mgnify:CR=1 FL=1
MLLLTRKRKKLEEWIQKQKQTVWHIQKKTHLTCKETDTLKVKG